MIYERGDYFIRQNGNNFVNEKGVIIWVDFYNKKVLAGVLAVFGIAIVIIVCMGIQKSKASGVSSVNYNVEGRYDVTINQSTPWKSGDRYGFVCNVTIKNISENKVEDWSLDIDFNSDIKIEQKWCGNFEENGTKVNVTGMSYNRVINKGEQISFGFVAYSEEEFNLENITVNGILNSDNTNTGDNIETDDNEDADNTNKDNNDEENDDINNSEDYNDNNVSDDQNQNNDNNVPDEPNNETVVDNDKNEKSNGFKVSGNKLLDAKGNEFIMRGVNMLIIGIKIIQVQQFLLSLRLVLMQ